jgi:hypothetical protein
MKRLALLLLVLSAGVAAAKVAKKKSFELPESALQDPTTGFIFVSNIGNGAPDGKDGNGFISRLKPTGLIAELRFLPKRGDPPLNGPKGLAMARGLLWVADIDRVVAFDPTKRKQVKEYPLAKYDVHFANDLLAAGDNLLYVSDTAGDQLISIDLNKDGDAALDLILKGSTGGANGIALDKATGDLLIAASAPDSKTKELSWRLHTVAGMNFHQMTPLPFAPAIGDGIAATNGSMFLGDWATGTIYRSDKGGPPIALFTGIRGPADFALSADGKKLILVDMVAGEVELKAIK